MAEAEVNENAAPALSPAEVAVLWAIRAGADIEKHGNDWFYVLNYVTPANPVLGVDVEALESRRCVVIGEDNEVDLTQLGVDLLEIHHRSQLRTGRRGEVARIG